jgi:hypothetical protein
MVAGRVMIPCTLADSDAVNPPDPTGLVTLRIASAAVPPVTVLGKKPILFNAAGGGTGRSVIVVPSDELLYEAVTNTGVFAGTIDVVAVTVPLWAPAGIASVAGTLSTVGLLLVRETTAPVP